MRLRIVTIACAVLAALILVWAQRPRVSPHESTRATVDGANLSIEYGRPYMKGRKIFGALVPYDRAWCPGADEATKLTTSRALKIGDLTLPAGAYSLWMLPSAADWMLIINKQPNLFHLRRPVQDDLGQVKLQKRSLASPVEQLTFLIEKNPKGPGGVIKMQWENTEVSAPFLVQ